MINSDKNIFIKDGGVKLPISLEKYCFHLYQKQISEQTIEMALQIRKLLTNNEEFYYKSTKF